PNSLPLLGSRPRRRKVLVAPALSLSLGGSESMDDFPAAFLSPSPEDEDEGDLDIDLDAMETPSDSESLLFPALELEDHLQHLGVGASPGSREPGLGALGQEDVVDKEGSRWRCFCPGEPPQEAWVNMSVLEPFLRVLSHGGYHGDGMNDVIVFSSCFLPENSLENYQYVMDNLFRLRKNLKGFYVVHPTWYIKALITIIKPFISSKFSRKLRFVETLQELAELVPLEQLQVPACVRQ
uniref:CRAL-TRIO domain-containing protein n=1 Tax=Tetraodon nigroviridis TaxID=99883 RepID=H3DLC1_TETNG